MIGLFAERKKWIDIGSHQFLVKDLQDIFGKSLALSSSQLAEYVRKNKLSGQSLLVGRGHRGHKGGQTRDSMQFHRLRDRRGNALPQYMARPGVGVRGSLNYLYGMAKGAAASKLGKGFNYARPRPFVSEAWKEWGGGRKVRSLSEAVQSSYLRELAGRAPEVETFEVKA
jgi:hypothetical protein